MKPITLNNTKQFTSDAKILHEILESSRERFQNEKTFYNTEASVLWIIRGCIDYFDRLDSDFLGEGNDLGIPDAKADQFANNIYRLLNALEYLLELWKIEERIELNQDLSLLSDLRTWIVHSGEQVSNLISLSSQNFKDSQLGRIIKKGYQTFQFPKEYDDMDYRIEIWNDRKDKQKARKFWTEVDYNAKKGNQVDLTIYLKAESIRNIVLSHIEEVLDLINSTDVKLAFKKLPEIKDRLIDSKAKSIDFDKIGELLAKGTRNVGYIIEDGVHHWDGFGLKRMLMYTQSHFPENHFIRKIVEERITKAINTFWECYQDPSTSAEEFPSLDIRHIFSDFTPRFDQKAYLEGEKLFHYIAPYFNTNVVDDRTDIDYLNRFLIAVNDAFKIKMNTEQTVDNFVCDYFIQSIQSKTGLVGQRKNNT
ncbi:hypothetical protein [Streptococcus moroccensis]|uniref:Uncharacterized protein n=1 Tax=Streptococcus moroccensis TaxID=1451356 RepID=A0ABT9YRA2_9STRE|nr:hypothetical protein [Streptococcus moroccensis]MDQ0222300.1 hypothetical protein [Streptococcus moroccensis]